MSAQAATATIGVCSSISLISQDAIEAERAPGKVGKDSAAARFAAATPSDDFSVQDDRPYAEARPLFSRRTIPQNP